LGVVAAAAATVLRGATGWLEGVGDVVVRTTVGSGVTAGDGGTVATWGAAMLMLVDVALVKFPAVCATKEVDGEGNPVITSDLIAAKLSGPPPLILRMRCPLVTSTT